MTTLLTAIALATTTATPQGISIPRGTIAPKPTFTIPVNVIKNSGFETMVDGKAEGWTGGSTLSYIVIPWDGGDPYPDQSHPPIHANYGVMGAGRASARSYDMGPYQFTDWEEHEQRWLDAWVGQTLSNPVLGSKVTSASVYIQSGEAPIANHFATIYYTTGEPTTYREYGNYKGYSNGYGKFDFKPAIDPNRTISAIQIGVGLWLDGEPSANVAWYNGEPVLIDDVTMTVAP